MSDKHYLSQLVVGGERVDGGEFETLREKFAGKAFGKMAVASPEQIDLAVYGAQKAFERNRLEPVERFEVLTRAASLVSEWSEEFYELIINETGFTRVDAENEVRRCVQTLQLSAEEAKRLSGQMVPMDATRGLLTRLGFTVLVPRGVVCAITPYNSPLNTVAHKIGPALAGGNSVVLKPSEFTPLTASLLCQAFYDAGLPAGLLSLLHGPGKTTGRALLADPRIAYYTFTGSTRVGKEIQQAAGLRGTQLELGSIASTIICHDADLEVAVSKLMSACFRKAGQVCTSVQRVLVDRSIYAQFVEKLVASAAKIPFGDPLNSHTVVGPMITLDHAQRAERWITEAVEAGARVLLGGTREGSVVAPTILENVSADMKVVCEEIFAPVVSIMPFVSLDEAVRQANGTPFGLAVGLFTRDISTALRTAKLLDFGGIHINETSSSRVDVMPFGGVKDSGFGREGPRYAVREMMEERLVTISY
ncbi:MAG: aldehyde dehydrogenase family protein [Acidovorax sp.]|uniref:aldehyde dehydrogenase family protein n=1 Tax=Acidovorax sp. TaxID=1872122 RepID=UPI003919F444